MPTALASRFASPIRPASSLTGFSFGIPASSGGALTYASKRGYVYLKFYSNEVGGAAKTLETGLGCRDDNGWGCSDVD